MPTYTYKCRKCGRTYDHVEAMIAEPHPTCILPATGKAEACGGKVFRVIGPAAAHYKGAGFHNTDYSRK